VSFGARVLCSVRCLNPFSGLCGTTEVVPFPDRDGKRNPSDIKKASPLS
jgi:hypothetical protein